MEHKDATKGGRGHENTKKEGWYEDKKKEKEA
jgi:hypothetical protein